MAQKNCESRILLQIAVLSLSWHLLNFFQLLKLLWSYIFRMLQNFTRVLWWGNVWSPPELLWELRWLKYYCFLVNPSEWKNHFSVIHLNEGMISLWWLNRTVGRREGRRVTRLLHLFIHPCREQSTVYSVQCTVYTVRCILYNVLPAGNDRPKHIEYRPSPHCAGLLVLKQIY